MTQIPILSGIYADQTADFRTSYPRNLVPVPKQTGLASGYLRPADGIEQFSSGPGVDRGGFVWNGVLYRVMGTRLVRIAEDGGVMVLGDVGTGGQVTMDNGFDRLAIWAGGDLYYLAGTSLTRVTDPDLGRVIDGRWIGGYYLSTDGTSLVVTELADPMAVNPLKYGSAETDPDPIMAVDELRNEAYAFGRFTIEVFENVGGSGFPFRRVDGAQVPRGIVGTHAYCQFAQTFAFVGNGKNNGSGEPVSVYLLGPGTTATISTREIDLILSSYTDSQLSSVVLETRKDGGHETLLVHLPDRCLCYDVNASKSVGEPVWYSLDSGLTEPATYRARGLCWCYGSWIAGDPTSNKLGRLTDSTMTHYGQATGWEFGTMLVYNEGRSAIIHELELVTLPGRVGFGADPVIWTSYTHDGELWSQEWQVSAGKQGQRDKRICWRGQGQIRQWRAQKFRGTSDARLSIARLEATIEPLGGAA